MKTLKEFQEQLIQNISNSNSYQILYKKYQDLRKYFCKEVGRINNDIGQLVANASQEDRDKLIDRYVAIPYYTDYDDLYAQIKECGISCRGDISAAYLDMYLKNCILRAETIPDHYRYRKTDDVRASCSGMVFISKEEYDEIKSHLKDEN